MGYILSVQTHGHTCTHTHTNGNLPLQGLGSPGPGHLAPPGQEWPSVQIAHQDLHAQHLPMRTGSLLGCRGGRSRPPHQHAETVAGGQQTEWERQSTRTAGGKWQKLSWNNTRKKDNEAQRTPRRGNEQTRNEDNAVKPGRNFHFKGKASSLQLAACGQPFSF